MQQRKIKWGATSLGMIAAAWRSADRIRNRQTRSTGACAGPAAAKVRISALILTRTFTVAIADTAVFFWARQVFQSSDYTSSERAAQATPWTRVTGRGGTA